MRWRQGFRPARRSQTSGHQLRMKAVWQLDDLAVSPSWALAVCSGDSIGSPAEPVHAVAAAIAPRVL